MEVLVGPTFTIEVSSSSSSSSSSAPPPSYPRDHLPAAVPEDHTVPSLLLRRPASSDADSSESSSSIGTPDDSDNDLSFSKDGDAQDDDEEVQSKFHGLGSLDALEDSLPIKRGLSSHFEGKSKSFSDLSEITNVKDLKKQENPFNKRRRLLIASKMRRSAFYSWSNPKSMPLLPVGEEDDDDCYNYQEEKAREVPSPASLQSPRENKLEDPVQLRQSRVPESYAARMRLRLGSMKARSFSLADLQEHDEGEDDEEEEAYD